MTSILNRADIVNQRPVFNNDAFKKSIEKTNEEKLKSFGNFLPDDEEDFTEDVPLGVESQNPVFR